MPERCKEASSPALVVRVDCEGCAGQGMTGPDGEPGATMFRWIVLIVVFAALAAGSWVAWGRVRDEKVCYDTNKCDDRLHSLETQLEFYSNDQVLAAEKESGQPSKRRAFYPPDLDTLTRVEKGSVEFLSCPVYGVPYRYASNADGTSFFAYCPARHRFHYDDRPFVNAIVPDAIDLHLVVSGGKVINLAGGHPNPWDFQTPPRRATGADAPGPGQAEVETTLKPEMFQMLEKNPPPTSRW